MGEFSLDLVENGWMLLMTVCRSGTLVAAINLKTNKTRQKINKMSSNREDQRMSELTPTQASHFAARKTEIFLIA